MIDGVKTPMRQMYDVPILGGFFYVYGARSANFLLLYLAQQASYKVPSWSASTSAQLRSTRDALCTTWQAIAGRSANVAYLAQFCYSLSAEACHLAGPTYAKTTGEHAPGYRLHISPPCLALQVFVRLISSSLPVP